MDELRARAEALGIDPAPFGDNAHALLAAIEAAVAALVPKMTRTATALTHPVEIDLADWPPR